MNMKLMIVLALVSVRGLMAQEYVTEKAKEVAKRLTGSYQNTEQAVQPGYVLVRVTSCPVQVEQDGLYLYVEQTAIEFTKKPYRQRVYRIRDLGSEVIESKIFKINNQDDLVGVCERKQRIPMVPKDRLQDIECAVKLKPVGDVFTGTTGKEGCPTSFGGAVRAESEVTLYESGFDAWDRGYNSEGVQVWGPTEGPYKFRETTQ